MGIKKALPSDAGEILAVQKLAFQSEGKLWNDYTIPPLIETEDEFLKDLEKNIILKAVLD